MSIFGTIETDVKSWFTKAQLPPVLQDLESVFVKGFQALIGEVNWGSLTSAVASVAESELTTVEAHNKIVALAATFLPAGAADSVITMVASGAVNVIAKTLQAVPVPATPTPTA